MLLPVLIVSIPDVVFFLSQLLSKGSESGSYPCTPTAILPRSAYWHHITGNQTGMDPGSGTPHANPYITFTRDLYRIELLMMSEVHKLLP